MIVDMFNARQNQRQSTINNSSLIEATATGGQPAVFALQIFFSAFDFKIHFTSM